METTSLTWGVSIVGLLLIGFLGGLQLVAVLRPRSEWTVKNVYGGSPDATEPRAYFAFNQGYAWADPFFWAPGPPRCRSSQGVRVLLLVEA